MNTSRCKCVAACLFVRDSDRKIADFLCVKSNKSQTSPRTVVQPVKVGQLCMPKIRIQDLISMVEL